MSDTLRIILIVVSILCMLITMRKISRSKAHIDDSIFWILGCIFLVVISIFPQVADFLRDLCGIDTTVHFLYLAMIFILLVKQFNMTLKISTLEAKLKEFAQNYALDHDDQAAEYEGASDEKEA